MKTSTVWLIIAAVFLLLGAVLFLGAVWRVNFDFSRLGGVQYVTNTYEPREGYQGISIHGSTADIRLVPSDTGSTKVICQDEEKILYSVAVQGDTLEVVSRDTRKWYEHIRFFPIGTPSITLYLPPAEYAALTVSTATGDTELPKELTFESICISGSTGDVTCYASAARELEVRVDTGNILVENVSAGSMDLSASTGKITAASVSCEGELSVTVSTGKARLNHITCGTFTSAGSTGDLLMEDVIADTWFSITRSTGDVTFRSCDAAELFVSVDTGDVTGSLLTEKQFLTQTSTGQIHVPKTATGGKCEITTSTGDIEIEIP